MTTSEARARIGFDRLVAMLAAKGAHNPRALAAYIGRKKYGKAGFKALQAAGRRTHRSAYPAMCVRAFGFEMRSAGGDGRTLEGYAAVFDAPARIRDMKGPFEETIRHGAFTRSLETRTPVLQFEHGRDPRVGAVPIGAIDDVGEDARGLRVRARLFDNPVVEPVRQAIAGKAIRGMSFRFDVPEGGDRWGTSERGEWREIREANVHELGPVVFPAYDATTVGVRSLLATVGAEEREALIRELAEQLAQYVDLKDFAGRSDAGRADGGDNGARPGMGEAPTVNVRVRADEDALRLRGILK